MQKLRRENKELDGAAAGKQEAGDGGDKMEICGPIIKKIRYWRDYTGSGDLYRKYHDLDCILTGGNLSADTIFSLWLPLRYTLNYYGCDPWEKWKEYEYAELRPKRLGLKDCIAFLDTLAEDMETFLPLTEPLTCRLSELFRLGQQRSNVCLLPYRKWNSSRGNFPYWDYFPHFLFDLLSTDSPVFLHAVRHWIREESLEMFFEGEIIDQAHIKDLAGTGAPWKHSPANIDLPMLIDNYISILKYRQQALFASA